MLYARDAVWKCGDWYCCTGNAGCTLILDRFPCWSHISHKHRSLQPKVMHHRKALSVEKLQGNEEKEYRYQFPTKITPKDHTNQYWKVLQLPKFYIT